MSDLTPGQESKITPNFQLQFGDEIEMEEYGYAFRPIDGFKLEIDGSIYMYSDDGSFEIHLIGGKLDDKTSIAELNDDLIAAFMENVDHFEIIESGKDTLKGSTGFVNDIHFVNVEEEGIGRALICSPFINQYFLMLVIASNNQWHQNGEMVFNSLKEQVHFHPQFKPQNIELKSKKHPDLTIETYENIAPDEDFILTIEKGDASFLLAARSTSPDDEIWVSNITTPDGKLLYGYNPETGEILSVINHKLLSSTCGEVCLYLPSSPETSLQTGEYLFNFNTKSGSPLQEVQVIIRAGRALDKQKMDVNFWAAVDDGIFTDPVDLEIFEKKIHEALEKQLKDFNLSVGKITTFHPAPDELKTFKSLNIDADLSDCSYMVADTVENLRALNIALVQELTHGDPSISSEIGTLSAGSPGMILASTSPHACIVAKWTCFKDDLDRFAKTIIQELIIFSGIDLEGTQQQDKHSPILNREVAWRLRKHPIFYDAD
jgi:hypothetical protein